VGISFYTGPTGEPGEDSLATTFQKKDSISGFLSWAQRILRFEDWGPSGTLVKGQDSTDLISDYGAQKVHL